MSVPDRFFAELRSIRLDQTVCGDNGAAGLQATLGTNAGIDPEDLEHARLILLRPFAGASRRRRGRCEFFSDACAAAGRDPLPAYEPSARRRTSASRSHG